MSSTRGPPRSRRQDADRRAYLAKLCRTVPYSYVEAVLDDPRESSIPELDSFNGVVLHASVLGFTTLCEELADEGAQGLSLLTETLNGFFSRLLEDAVFPYSGYVVHFGGDSLTAVFRGDDVDRRAAACALGIRDIVHQAGKQLGESTHELMARVGLARGETHLFVFGDISQRRVVSSGTTAHRAVDLMRRAAPGSIVVDALVRDALGAGAEIVNEATTRDLLLLDLTDVPSPAPIVPLGDRINDDVEAKIALLEPFVPAPLAARLRSTPAGWRVEGELRDVVVLTAELTGLDGPRDTSAEARDKAVEFGRNVSRSMLRAFRKYGGMTTKAELIDVGHRLTVLFGLYRPSENDVERALLAALEASARVRGLGASEGVGVQLRIGVHSGPAYFGAFGSDWRHDVTVVGTTVNIASRIAQRAAPFEVLATEAITSCIEGEFEHSEKPSVTVPGVDGPIPLRVVHSPADQRSHYVRFRQVKRFYAGRDAAVARLAQLTETASSGKGTSLALVGEAGTGKSALLSTLIDEWTKKGGVGVLGRCRYATRTIPLAPVMAIFESFLGLTPSDVESERRDRIRRGLQRFELGDRADELTSLLLPVERTDGVVESLVDLADVHARERVLSAILAVVERRLEEQPLMYVLEDLHHADSLTLELATRVCRTMGNRSFMLVGTFRPDPVVATLREAMDHVIEVKPLSPPDAAALVMHEGHADAVDAPFLDFLVRRTGGNPRYLVEMLRFLKERGLMTVRGGVAVAPTSDPAFLEGVVPGSLAQMTLASLDEMGAIERRLLRTASAIGPRFSSNLLAAAADDLPPDVLYAAVANLEGANILAADADRAFTFRDDVTRAVTYQTIPGPERRLVHARIAEAIEALPEDDSGRSPSTLAVHWERAGNIEKAVAAYERAARLALRAGLTDDTCLLVDRWTALCAELPKDQAPVRATHARMQVVRLMALGRRGIPGETLKQCREMVRRQLVFEETTRRVVDYWLGEALVGVGKLDEARERLERVFRYASEAALRCDAGLLVARTYELSGDTAGAREWVEKSAELVAGDPYRTLQVDLVRAHLLLGPEELEQAIEIYTRVQEKAAALMYARVEAHAANGRAHAAMHLRRFDEAIDGFGHALQTYRNIGSWGDVANAMLNLGQVLLWSGRPEEAESHLEKALALAEQAEDELCSTEARVHLGAVVALTEDMATGVALIDDGARRAKEMGWHEPAIAAGLHRLHIAVIREEPELARGYVAALHASIDAFPTLLFQTLLAHYENRLTKLERAAATAGDTSPKAQ